MSGVYIRFRNEVVLYFIAIVARAFIAIVARVIYKQYAARVSFYDFAIYKLLAFFLFPTLQPICISLDHHEGYEILAVGTKLMYSYLTCIIHTAVSAD